MIIEIENFLGAHRNVENDRGVKLKQADRYSKVETITKDAADRYSKVETITKDAIGLYHLIELDPEKGFRLTIIDNSGINVHEKIWAEFKYRTGAK